MSMHLSKGRKGVGKPLAMKFVTLHLFTAMYGKLFICAGLPARELLWDRAITTIRDGTGAQVRAMVLRIMSNSLRSKEGYDYVS